MWHPLLLLLVLVFPVVGCASPEDEIAAFSGGGSATGGAAAGGASSGGSATGATTSGGVSGVGGTPSGGSAGTGGATPATGGASLGSCTDQVMNGLETDVDCGGPCEPCQLGQACISPNDCLSLVCDGGSCGHCGDGILNGDETDIDCGGACGGCIGEVCADATPCSRAFACADGVCSTCGNGEKDGDETGRDCGGSCLLCTGAACASPDECLSGDCPDGTCAAASCVEGWETVTRDAVGASDWLCADVQPGGPFHQGDREGCADILDCLVANATTCATYSACVSQNPGSATCDVVSDMPARQYAQATYDQMCQ